MGGVVGAAAIGSAAFLIAQKSKNKALENRPIVVAGPEPAMAQKMNGAGEGGMGLTMGEMAALSAVGGAVGSNGAAASGTLNSVSTSGSLNSTTLSTTPLHSSTSATLARSTSIAYHDPYSDPSLVTSTAPIVAPISTVLSASRTNVPLGIRAGGFFRATRPFRAGMDDEVDVEVGEVVRVLEAFDGGLQPCDLVPLCSRLTCFELSPG